MSRQLYEEAIADARHIKNLAEDNAKRAVIAAVEPQIRNLIEQHLMEGSTVELGDDPEIDDVSIDFSAADQDAAAITPPGPDGKVTLDLDALGGCAKVGADDEFVLNAESIAALEPVLSGVRRASMNEIELQTYRLGEAIAEFTRVGNSVRRSRGFSAKISEMISRVKNTYECVQESVDDSAKKRSLERKLEAFNRALVRLTESQMSIRRGSRVNEGDITLKLTGVPDELDLDNVGIDLIKDEGGEGDDGDAELDLDDGGEGDGGDDLDLTGDGDGDSGDGDGDDGEEEEAKMGEGRRLSDSTVVDIDEGMLRREISRMRTLREEAAPSTAGRAPRGSELDDFGGGSDAGDPWLDSDVPDGGTCITIVGEGEEGDDEILEIDEDDVGPPMGESRSRRRPTQRMGESRRFMGRSAEAGSARRGTRSNSGPRQLTEHRAASSELRSQVSQLNLRNAKLAAATKLLQNESLTRQQRADITDQLESARSSREVKLVYESLTRAYRRGSRSLSEGHDRRILGSASRPTSSAGSTLNESSEAARWAQLAGIR